MQSRQSSNSPIDPSNHQAQPEVNDHEVIARFDLSDMPKPELTGHAWRQRGTELVCESCPFTHSSYIPPSHQLYGIDSKGYPMFRKVEVH